MKAVMYLWRYHHPYRLQAKLVMEKRDGIFSMICNVDVTGMMLVHFTTLLLNLTYSGKKDQRDPWFLI